MIRFTSQESEPPFFHPAQINIFGMFSIYPAALYISSHSELLIMGTETSWRTEGSGPSKKNKIIF